MADVSFEINGKLIEPEQVQTKTERTICQAIIRAIHEIAGGEICQIHGLKPAFACRGNSFLDFKIEVLACCQGLEERVKSRFDGAVVARHDSSHAPASPLLH